MATSTITLYKTELTPSRNALVDNLESYLEQNISLSEREIQYQKIDLDMSVKINMDQSMLKNQTFGNYAKITIGDEQFYFFIVNAAWKSQNTVELVLSIDSINTFRYRFEWSDKTTVVREHRDRFEKITKLTPNTANNLVMRVDNVDEGLGTLYKVKVNDEQITSNDSYLNQTWYLVYRSPQTPDANSPIECILMPTYNNIAYQSATSTVSWTKSNLVFGSYYYWTRTDNGGGSVTISGAGTYSFNSDSTLRGIVLYNDGTYVNVYTMKQTTGDATTPSTLKIERVIRVTSTTITWNISTKYRRSSTLTADLQTISGYTEYPLLVSSSGTRYIRNISAIDRTDSKIVKIIECPYCPETIYFSSGIMSVPAGWRIDEDGYLKLITLTKDFSHNITSFHTGLLDLTVAASNDYTHISKKIEYEPKLFHSSAYTLKMVYDSYSSEILLENLRLNPNGSSHDVAFILQYKQSNGITSDCGFKAFLQNHKSYKETSDYDLRILSTRSNESTIYTNAYLDYVRTGYNYDKKNAASTVSTSWLGAGISLVGAVASFAASGATGGISSIAAISLATSAVASISSAISTTASAERSLQQKQNELKAQAGNVTGSNDLNLLNWYSNNKVHAVQYSATDEMKEKLFDLYYYCGYATNRQKLPDFDSRYWFNFVQCEPVFNDIGYSDVMDKYINDIKSRFSAGVTVYHEHNGEYDWTQDYENFEIGLVS